MKMVGVNSSNDCHVPHLTGAPSLPVLMHSKSDISTDDNLDTEIPKEFKRRSKKSAEDRYISGLPRQKSTRKKKKVKLPISVNHCTH
jgi:hypothetical protein